MRKAIFILSIILALPGSTVRAKSIKSSFPFEGIKRTYFIHLPRSYDGTVKVPLVLNMHGFAEGARLHIRVTGMNEKADEEGFIVVYPDGTGWPKAWNSGFAHRGKKRSSVDDVGFINALIDTLISRYEIDTLRIYACGFSNGGMMSHMLACQMSDRIAAIAAVAGGLTATGCAPRRPVPVIHIHARNDPIVRYYGDTLAGETLYPIEEVMTGWALRNGCNHGPDSARTNDGLALKQRWYNDDGMEVILWTTEDGNHAWPGGKGFSFPGATRPARSLDANDLIWKFFETHPIESP